MSNLSTYYSFNVPDVNLNNQIVNWATGSPVYDASLNGAAYISSNNYKIGYGSLEMQKQNTLTEVVKTPISNKNAAVISIAVSDNQLKMLLSSTTNIYYRTRTAISNAWGTETSFVSNTGTQYFSISMTSDGSRFVTNVASSSGLIYYGTWTSDTPSTLTRINDSTVRYYNYIAITKDGNRLVATTNSNIYFATWNNDNYSTLTVTPITNGTVGQYQFYGITISPTGDKIVYADITNKFWFLSYWDGKTYNIGAKINTTATTYSPRSAYFTKDTSCLYLSYNSSGYSIQSAVYNNNTKSYDISYNLTLQNALNCHGLSCIDSNDKCTIYACSPSGSSNTNIYISDISYNTTSANYCMIKSPIIDTNGLTIACWFRSNYNLNNARIFDFATANTGTSDNIRLLINNNALKFEIYKSSTNNSFNITSVNINDYSWNHIAITMSYSSGITSTIKFYINGSITTDTNINKPYPTLSSTANRVYSYLGKSNTTTDPQFFGNIDDFRIYNAVLNDTQISTLYTDTNVKNNYVNSTISLLYTTSADNASSTITPVPTNVGINKTYYYWNDPYAITNTIINKSNPYNFYYTYNNTYIKSVTNILGCVLWLDAADSSTVTSSSGSISKWNDKSSSEYSLTGISGYQPTYISNSLNGLGGIQFTSTTYLSQLDSNLSNLASSTAISIYVVLKTPTSSASSGFNIILTDWVSGARRYHFSLYDSSTPGVTLYANSVLILIGNILQMNGTNAIVGFTISSTSSTISVNGSISTAGGANLPTAQSNNKFYIGDTRSAFTSNMVIYEILCFNSQLSQVNYQQVEGYLASKWGLQTSLPINHPYYNSNNLSQLSLMQISSYDSYGSANVSIITNELVTLKLNGSIQENLLNIGNTFSSPVTVPLVNGNNLFEFLTYNNNGGPAYFAAYVTNSNSNNIFSTISEKTGWNVNITGFYSNGYPVSSLIVGNSLSTAYINATAISTATNYRSFNVDLSSNKSCKRIKLLDTNLKSNNIDLGNIFLTYP